MFNGFLSFEAGSLLRRRASAGLVALGLAALLAACGGGGGDAPRPTETGQAGAPTAVASATEAVIAEPTATPGPPIVSRRPGVPVPGESPGDRLTIGNAKVNAPITLRVVPATGGELAAPVGPDDVAFYDFSAFPGAGGFPGLGGRVILSGHVDSGRAACKNGTVPPPCAAVFWDVDQLNAGDEIAVQVGGETHRYRVTSSEDVSANDQAKWDALWLSTPNETIALITCGGDFNRATSSYSHRHVVMGDRI